MASNKENDRWNANRFLADIASFLAQTADVKSIRTEKLGDLLETGVELHARANAFIQTRGEKRFLIRRIFQIRRELVERDLQATQPPAEQKRIVLPPRLFFDGMLRRFMSLGQYDRYIKPHVADMHEEYFTHLAKKDERGARWAVIRGHLYVVPSWLWAVLGRLLARVLGRVI